MDEYTLRDRLHHHLTEMSDWAEGRRSWTNMFDAVTAAQLDTAEVAKHGAAVQAYSVALMAKLNHPQPIPRR